MNPCWLQTVETLCCCKEKARGCFRSMILQQLYFKTVTEEEFPVEKHQILDTEMFLGSRKFVYIFIHY